MTFKVSDVYVTVIKVIKKYITAKITHLCRKMCQKVPKHQKSDKNGRFRRVLRVRRTYDVEQN